MVRMGLRRRGFELGRERIELGRIDRASNGENGVKKERIELGRERIELGRRDRAISGENRVTKEEH